MPRLTRSPLLRALLALTLLAVLATPSAHRASAQGTAALGRDPSTARGLPAGSRIPWQGQDWYLHGVNVPWVNWGRDFGGGSTNGGVSSGETRGRLDEAFAQARASGANTIRWWTFEGDPWQIARDPSGAPTSLEPGVYADFDAALELAEAHDLYYVFVLFSAPSHLPSSWLDNPGHRARLAGALAPLFARYKDHPRVMTWEIFNEPDFDVWKEKTKEESMRAVVREIGDAVHANSHAYVTVGMAMLDGLPMVKGLGLDYYQAHWYDYMQPGEWCAPCTNYDAVRAKYGLDGPLVIGEFYVGADLENPLLRLDDFYTKGYAGAWPWSLFPGSTHDKLEVDWNSMRIFAGRHPDLGPRAGAALAPSTAPPTARLGFSSTALAFPARVRPGERVTIDASVTATAGIKALVDIEIYSPTNEKLHQQVFDNQTFGPGQSRTFTTLWTVPAGAAPGDYAVKVGVFTPGWGKVYDWNDKATGFAVSR